jgi:hypothetical protein
MMQEREMEGWELDPEVIDAARPHLGIAELEAKGALAPTEQRRQSCESQR